MYLKKILQVLLIKYGKNIIENYRKIIIKIYEKKIEEII